MIDKRSQRRECFAALKSLPPELKTKASHQICCHIATSPEFLEAETVFSYLALPSEPDLSVLTAEYPEKTWAFSRVLADGERLAFHEVTSPDQISEGEFGFLEPNPDLCPEHSSPDLILVPGVGFDPVTGARLGRGKGHYDRFLAPFRGDVTAIGVCFSVQLTKLAPESHDVPMNFVITEKGRLSL